MKRDLGKADEIFDVPAINFSQAEMIISEAAAANSDTEFRTPTRT